MDIILQQRRQLHALEAEYLTLKAAIESIKKSTHLSSLNPHPSQDPPH